MKILFVLPRMVSGGVERVTLNLMGEFVSAGNECALALRQSYGELLSEAQSMVAVHELSPNGLHQFVPKLAKLIKQWKPTHIVTAFADVATMVWVAMCLARSGARWVHGVHNTHASVITRRGVWGRPRNWLDNRFAGFVYRHADAIVAVSEGVRGEIVQWFHADPARVTTIYNPVIPDNQLCPVQTSRHAAGGPFAIVALGRLVRQKGFDVLIDAMAHVPPPWRLDIWGEGPDRPLLEEKIAALNLQSTIRLRGHTSYPFDVLRGADLFVLPSRYEGLGNALIEALACQCQVVATDCSHGPREILRDGKLGQLVAVADVMSLSRAIKSGLSGRVYFDRHLLLDRARQFTLHAAAVQWVRVLEA